MAKRAASSKSDGLSDASQARGGTGDEGHRGGGETYPISRLDQIIGQTTAKRTLQSAVASGRTHHAWIFHGPAGVGKFTTAVAFGALLFDPTTAPDLGGDHAPAPGSQVQTLVRAGTHPDLHVINKELAAVSRDPKVRDGKQMSIARAVLDEFVLEPAARTRVLTGSSAIGKVFIIDEAELIVPAIQNLLLKTLEEPPLGTVFILITSAEDRLLTTIRSRCQRVLFTPLDDEEFVRWMRASGISVTPEVAGWLRSSSAGSPGAAKISVLHELYAWHTELRPLVDQLLKGVFPASLASEMDKRVGERAAEAVKRDPHASKDAANKAWSRRMLSFIADQARLQLRARATKVSPADLPEDEQTLRILALVDAISEAERQIAANVGVPAVFDGLVARALRQPALA